MEGVLIIQGVGFLAMAIQLLAYISTCPRFVMRQLGVSSVIWSGHFTLMGNPAIGMIALTNSLRHFAGVYFSDRFMKIFVICLTVLICIYMLTEYRSIIDLLPMIAAICGGISCLYRDNKLIFFGIIFPGILCWMSFHIMTGSVPGVMTEICMLIMTAQALFRSMREDKQLSLKTA